ncbi:histidinol dehydrogenase [Campylobacter sp. 19-13652]|uniref:histidinol dehydrogenase n=1 Tax=Campylobacter sp. 19-13652 TaxID=2840180 RepID=UPI001C77861A|nr:histidinol dehydrogenase [Campylobacter sp. 19-13652]BCX79416.1 histidinol dehydrogenase [Campylobacter sp. 19-13652]
MRILNTSGTDFSRQWGEILGRGEMDMDNVIPVVSELLLEVKRAGDEALIKQVARFDRWQPDSADALAISTDEMRVAFEALDDELRSALKLAYERIKDYHERAKPSGFSYEDSYGDVLGARYTPVDRAGLYIPGGKAAYPSSLLMNAIPAIVAGVGEIVVCTPAVGGEVNALLLAAMHLCGVKKAYKLGGASAVAAMAYGTQKVPRVDVITGPGNIYVATAKKLVYGLVNIDMIAGPSEIGIIADDSANARHIAADLLSQAEHDELASSFLITPSKDLALAVSEQVDALLDTLSRKEIASKSINERGAILVARDLKECVRLANELAVEHLELAVREPETLIGDIRHAGAIFMGHFTPEAMGDYLAGPNHTLPTGGTARFYSPLSVENFMKKSSIISLGRAGFEALAPACVALADAEGLGAHALSVSIRLEK